MVINQIDFICPILFSILYDKNEKTPTVKFKAVQIIPK